MSTKGRIKPPSEALLQSQHFADDTARAEFLNKWNNGSSMGTPGFKFRNLQTICSKARAKSHAAAVLRVANGSACARTVKHVARGVAGPEQAPKLSTEEAALARERSNRLKNIREQVQYLVFQIQHLRGCAIDGCSLCGKKQPSLASNSSNTSICISKFPEIVLQVDRLGDDLPTTEWLQRVLQEIGTPPASDVPMCLLNWDHLDEKDKTNNMAHLTSAQRENERLTCASVCLAHHLVHTRQQLHWPASAADASKNASLYRELVHKKTATGCEFPQHNNMPWAQLLSTLHGQSDGKLSPYALAVAHHRRGGNPLQKQGPGNEKAAAYISDLKNGAASIFCRFCDVMWTSLESCFMHPRTPLSLHQLPVMRAYCRDFVDRFQQMTADVDWAAVARYQAERIVTGQRKGRDKRKAEQDTPSESTSIIEPKHVKKRKQAM
jgi:hypothetical protein